MKHFLFFWVAATAAAEETGTVPFVQPAVIDYDELLMESLYSNSNSNNNPIINLDLDWMELDLPNVPGLENKPFLTRALGGSFPGPTIKVSAGKTLRIRFHNKLEAQEGSVQNSDNDIDDPDTANLHFHGGHVSSESPGDDISHIRVQPGQSFLYELPIPSEHAPGTHWIHPHHHGSTSLHVGGGAALAFVVKDPDNYLSDVFNKAPETIMVFQDFDMVKLEQMTKRANDQKLRGSLRTSIDATQENETHNHRFVTVNGRYRPTLEIPQDEWQRWRIVFAGWRTSRLNFRFANANANANANVNANVNAAGCEFQLLAKDGIYISDFPRPVDALPIATGGRADVMVRCRGEPGKTTIFEAIDREVLAVVTTAPNENDANVENNNAGGELAPWSPATLPDYLMDLSSTDASPGCSCETHFSGQGDESLVNGLHYRSDHFLHTTYLGAVVERTLSFEGEHSYHQHMYPFQLVALDRGDVDTDNIDDSENNVDLDDAGMEPFLKMGDWHDSYHGSEVFNSATIRYMPTVLSGDLVLHCHNNIHSDRGMLAKEYVFPAGVGNRKCLCEVFGPIVVGENETENGNHINGDTNLDGDSIDANMHDEAVQGSEGMTTDGDMDDADKDMQDESTKDSEASPEGDAGEDVNMEDELMVKKDEPMDASEGGSDVDDDDEADAANLDEADPIPLASNVKDLHQQQPFLSSGAVSLRLLSRGMMAAATAVSSAAGLLLGFVH